MNSTLTNYEDQYIELKSDRIATLISSPSLFASIKITVQVNCCNCFNEAIITNYTPGSSSQNVSFTNDSIKIFPQFMELSLLNDLVATVTIEYRPMGGNPYINETFCGLVDVKLKCRVAAHIKNLLPENSKDAESLLFHLQYFGLKEGSNCNCNCDILCNLFTELDKTLSNYNIDTNCGC